MTCNYDAKDVFSSTITNREYPIINHNPTPLTCSSSNIIYLISCRKCGIQYVGETAQPLNKRMNNHRTAIRGKKNTILHEHFRGEGKRDIRQCVVQPIEQIDNIGSSEIQKKKKIGTRGVLDKRIENTNSIRA